jgi:hypothetical protein
MSEDCGECNGFRHNVERYYVAILNRFGFTLARCSSDYGGRECLLMYRSKQCQLLFIRSDGAEAGTIGSLEAPFPEGELLHTNGELGWYHVAPLVEFKSGKKVFTPRLLNEFRNGDRIYFEWESQLMSSWAEVLIEMFAPGKPQEWHDDFARYAQTRRYA